MTVNDKLLSLMTVAVNEATSEGTTSNDAIALACCKAAQVQIDRLLDMYKRSARAMEEQSENHLAELRKLSESSALMKREHYASMAMQGLLSLPVSEEDAHAVGGHAGVAKQAATVAVLCADALLQALEVKP